MQTMSFMKHLTTGRCIEVLRDFGREDWQLCSTVCKVLCNYSTHMTSSANTFGHKEAQLLSDLLIEYLGKYLKKHHD